MSRRKAALAVCLVSVVWLAAGCSSPSASDPSTSASVTPVRRPPVYGVGSTTFNFVDRGRRTPADGKAPALPYRSLPTIVLYPSTLRPATRAVPGAPPAVKDGPFPLIVFAHGDNSVPEDYEPLLEQWAQAGYVVAGPAFPLSNRFSPGGATISDYPQQPGDLSYVLSRVLDLDRATGDPVSRLIDASKIAAVGHSLGGITVLGWTENTCCEDPRVDAAVVIDGAELPFGSGQFFTGRTVPIMVFHGTSDTTVFYSAGQKIYEDAPGPKFFVSLIGAPHTSFRQIAEENEAPPKWEPVIVKSVLDFLSLELDHKSASLAALERASDISGTASLTQDP
jgi:predicted dienelactone hydrolase